MKMEQSIPKRWHIKFRRWGITQKKEYNIIVTYLLILQFLHICICYPVTGSDY